jgi:uncharacterized phage protein (TIGR01671 family)
MREIKFRGKTRKGLWVYGYLFLTTDNSIAKERLSPCIQVVDKNLYHRSFIVTPETVCQYTGLKDKNGKEIYENDIVKTFGKFIHQVNHEDGAFGYYTTEEFISFSRNKNFHFQDCQSNNLEVIGNIFDNHEMLGAAE